MAGTTWVRPRPYAAGLRVLALAVALAACSDDSSPLNPENPDRAPRLGDPGPVTSTTPVVRRVDLRFEVNGAFRPGVPVAITAVARGRRAADQVDLEVSVFDEPAVASTPPERVGRRRVGALQGPLGRGAERRVSQTVTFAAPGYYRVSARAVSSGPKPDLVAPGDSMILDQSEETLYVLVDENGGRLTDGYDPRVLAGREPAYGSFGPFLASSRSQGTRNLAPGDPAQQTSRTYTYYVEYDNNDTGTRSPVGGARAVIECLDTNFAVYSTLYPTVNTDGSFTFTCPYGYFDGRVELYDWYSEVTGEARAVAGVALFREYYNARLVAANKYAAHVFVTLRKYVPVVEQRFGNRWRSRLLVMVSETDSMHGPWYDPGPDEIRMTFWRVFGEDGRFVTMHEYGHAYQYTAIEPWINGACPSKHYTYLPSNRGCAYVEGFATFLSVWVTGNELTSGQNTDAGVESQSWYLNGDGLEVEGSVAGFLYDLVDGASQRDNTANSAAVEETWDTAVYGGAWIADLMQNCAPYTLVSGVYTYTSNLDGIDQLVYCMEGNVSAETYSSTWSSLWRKNWDGVSRGTVTLPTGYSTTLVRTLWKRNLYGAP